MQHEVEETEGDYPLALTLERGPVKVSVYYDECSYNPRREDDGAVGTILIEDSDYDIADESPLMKSWRGLASTYAANMDARSLAGALTERKVNLPDGSWHTWADYGEEVDWKESVDVRVLIPLGLRYYGGGSPLLLDGYGAIIGQKACRKYLAAMLDGVERPDGLYIATDEDMRSEYGNVRPENLRKMAKLMEGQLEEYAKYVAGEVFYLTTDDHNGCGDAVGGYIGYDSAREEAEAELDRLYDDYVAEVGDVTAWARSMGETLAGTYPPMEVPA